MINMRPSSEPKRLFEYDAGAGWCYTVLSAHILSVLRIVSENERARYRITRYYIKYMRYYGVRIDNK